MSFQETSLQEEGKIFLYDMMRLRKGMFSYVFAGVVCGCEFWLYHSSVLTSYLYLAQWNDL